LSEKDEDTSDKEVPFRHLSVFDDRKVLDILAHQQMGSMVVLGEPDQTNSKLHHALPQDKFETGLLHFFKKDDKWNFVTETELESKKKDLPALSFAIKNPIKNIESLEWPDLDKLSKEILDKDQADQTEFEYNGTKGPFYYSRSLINNEEIEVIHSESTILLDD